MKNILGTCIKIILRKKKGYGYMFPLIHKGRNEPTQQTSLHLAEQQQNFRKMLGANYII